jgi:hypothetical protein
MHRAEYTYHKAKASAYAHAGLSAKARSHSRRAAYYRTAFGAQKRHMIFVLSPLNAAMAAKLQAMLSEQGRQIDVYIQGFSNPALYPAECGDESAWRGNNCNNLLPAQFNQYASDDALALSKLIKANKGKRDVNFFIVPTQIVKNNLFNNAVKSEFKELLSAKWTELDDFVQRKIIAWHNRRQLNTASDLANKMQDLDVSTLASLSLEPLFDPFVAYIVDQDSVTGDGRLFEFVNAEVGEDDRLMPTISQSHSPDPSNVRFVRHKNTQSAVEDAKKYAQYIMRALTGAIHKSSAIDDANVEVSIVQDWADWDNPIAAKCILYTVPGKATLYSVGRPVESQGCGMPDYGAKWDGTRPSWRAPSWPPCTHVDEKLSTKEAINVAATWVAVFRTWLERAPNRILSVVNAGFTKYHGMNPTMHTPIVDIWFATEPSSVYGVNYYDDDESKKQELLKTLGTMDQVTKIRVGTTEQVTKMSAPVRVV